MLNKCFKPNNLQITHKVTCVIIRISKCRPINLETQQKNSKGKATSLEDNFFYTLLFIGLYMYENKSKKIMNSMFMEWWKTLL